MKNNFPDIDLKNMYIIIWKCLYLLKIVNLAIYWKYELPSEALRSGNYRKQPIANKYNKYEYFIFLIKLQNCHHENYSTLLPYCEIWAV